MRSTAFVVATAVLVSVLGVSQARYFDTPEEVMPYSIIDPIIKAVLEGLRPKVANLKMKDINQTIKHPSLNASILVNDILIQNLDKFEIKILKSKVVPLQLTNLTLTWDKVVANANYDVNAALALGEHGPFKLFGKGKAKAALNKLYLTVGANVELKDKGIQVKPKGLFGFDMTIGSADVTLTSLMGSSELGQALGVFVSKIIPDLVNTLKKPVFEAFHDDIVKVVNQILRKNGNSFFLEEEPSLPDLSLEDVSEDIESFFSQPLHVSSEDTEFNF